MPQRATFNAQHGFPRFGSVADNFLWRNVNSYGADLNFSFRMRFIFAATRLAMPLLATWKMLQCGGKYPDGLDAYSKK